ncbi:hypothetical protein WKV44_02980 [Spirochaetia bacterium 38H-sp]|uniref:Uncharacterized protein n=1 Tax=Rarispira pelagica TaxID=3141764 RepID=A0ABU9UBZ9_9SPIR
MAKLPHAALLKQAYRMDAVSLHNSLMRSSDHELAIVFLHLGDREKDYFLSVLSPEKKRRVENLLARLSHVLIPYDIYKEAVKLLIMRLGGENPPPLPQYYRPNRS